MINLYLQNKGVLVDEIMRIGLGKSRQGKTLNHYGTAGYSWLIYAPYRI
jgi:hypothetical protein